MHASQAQHSEFADPRNSPSQRRAHQRSHWRVHRRAGECLLGISCRRANRSGSWAPPSPCDTAFSEGSGSFQVLPGSSPIALSSPSSKAHQKSGSFPPPALPGFNSTTDPVRLPPTAVVCYDVEAAALAHDGSPPITRITFSTCHAHYPGEPNGCSRRFLPRPRGLPRYAGGSAFAPSLSRPAQASLTLRPVELLSRQGDLCHEAPARSVAQPSRSSATRRIDNFLGGTFLHW